MTDDTESTPGQPVDAASKRLAPVTALFGQPRSDAEISPEPAHDEANETPEPPQHIAPVTTLRTRSDELVAKTPVPSILDRTGPLFPDADPQRRHLRRQEDGTVALPWRAESLDAAEAQERALARERRSEHRGAGRRDAPPADGVDDDAPTRDEALATAEQQLLRRLRRGDRSREELRRELAGDEHLDEAGIEAILEKLDSLGYIDDLRMAETLADKLFDRRGKGIEAVRRELRHRFLSDEAIEHAIDGRERDDEFSRAAELAVSRAERLRGVDRETALRRLVGFLQRRGFGSGVAFIAANDALNGVDAPPRSPSGSAGTSGTSGVYFGNTDG